MFSLLSMVQHLLLMTFKVSFHHTWKKKSILDGDPINIDRKKSVEFIEMTSNGLFFFFFLNFIILKMHCMDKMVPQLYAGTVTSNGMHIVKCFSYGLAKEQVVEEAGRNGA